MLFDIFLILSVVTLLFYLVSLVELYFGSKSIKFLEKIDSYSGNKFPFISIIVAARNEEKNIKEALQSLLNLNYPEKEIIIVNDRSVDNTGKILEEIKADYPFLKIVEILELPNNWLGKNYALQKGSEYAKGEYILFTDADIIMKRNTLDKAMNYVLTYNVDHLVIPPDVIMPTFFLKMFFAFFIFSFTIFVKPWKAKNPKSKYSIGIGAFNLIKKSVYNAIGKHEKIKMRPDDDLKLGKLIKLNGYKQDTLFGKNIISVEWYSSMRELINGLNKNSFATLDYNLFKVIGQTFGIIIVFILPFILIFITSGLIQIINFVIIFLIALIYYIHSTNQNIKLISFFVHPISVFLFLYIIWKSAIDFYKNDGINWRGTHYNADDLKRNVI